MFMTPLPHIYDCHRGACHPLYRMPEPERQTCVYRTTAAKRKSSKKSRSVPAQVCKHQQCPVYSFFTATLRHFYGAFMTCAVSPGIFLGVCRSGAAGSWSVGRHEVAHNKKGTHDGKPRGTLARFRCHGRTPHPWRESDPGRGAGMLETNLYRRATGLAAGRLYRRLKAKPETPEEVAGTFEALYEYDTVKVKVDTSSPLIDNCGTGGDILKTLNISTGAGIIAAACGQSVVRHAARAVSSHCGAIDVIEALGVNVESAPELPKQSLEQAGICTWNGFLPAIHPKALARLLSPSALARPSTLLGRSSIPPCHLIRSWGCRAWS